MEFIPSVFAKTVRRKNKRITDIVNNQIMAHLYRKVMKVGPTKNALLAMIDIACRERGKETKPNMIINI
jgi:hypothetical protein